MKCAIITGITGQDGSYLAEYLLSLGYRVYGGMRRVSSSPSNVSGIIDHENLKLFHLDFMDTSSIDKFVGLVSYECPRDYPLEVYNLAAQSHVGESFKYPVLTHQINTVAPVRLLESLMAMFGPNGFKFYQASTSELYGNVKATKGGESVADATLNENTPFSPTSPYAISKRATFDTVRMYREAFSIEACNGILFNHESPRRGVDFVTRKITRYVARGDFSTPLLLGNLDSTRDWGDARDYVKAMHMMLNSKYSQCQDYVVATGKNISVRTFCKVAFKQAGFDLDFIGSGINEVGFLKATGSVASIGSVAIPTAVINISTDFYRPSEVHNLCGDSSRIRKELGWKPSISFNTMVKDMIDSDKKGTVCPYC